MKAFISYSFQDAAKFDDLTYSLDLEKVPYWNTDEIAAGQSLRDKLRDAVRKCAVCVFLATENSIKSSWCLAEVGAFWGAGKPVILYLEDEALRETDLPKQFQGDKWTPHMRDVVKALKLHLSEAAQEEQERRSPLAEYNRDSMALYALKSQGLREALSDVWLIGATMHHTLSNIQSLIMDKITAGMELNVMIADPAGAQYEMTARSFGQEREALELESVTTLKACVRMEQRLNQQENVAGKLNVRLIDELFTAGVYFIDPKSETGRMMLVPHVPGQDAAEVPGFVFQPSSKGPLEHYFDMYQRVWKRATPFKVWAEANGAYLE
jgi:hypothetical protein